MSPVDGMGGVAPGGLPGAVGDEHSGQGSSAGAGKAPSFSASYALALSKASSPQGAIATAGHAHAAGTARGAPASASTGGARHIPLAGQQHEGGRSFQETALALRTYRQQLLASNIANADTPGYKAVDFDFREALRIAQSAMRSEPVKLTTTAKGHIVAQIQNTAFNIPLKYHVPHQAGADGNTVEMDVERAKFGENAIRYEFALQRVGGHFDMLVKLINGLKD